MTEQPSPLQVIRDALDGMMSEMTSRRTSGRPKLGLPEILDHVVAALIGCDVLIPSGGDDARRVLGDLAREKRYGDWATRPQRMLCDIAAANLLTHSAMVAATFDLLEDSI